MKTVSTKSKVVALSLLAAVGISVAPASMAQSYDPSGALVGGLIGGAIGNSAFSGHNRNDRAAATAGLAIVGAMIGGQVSNQPQPYYGQPAYQPSYSSYSYAEPVYYAPAPVVYSRPPVIYAAPVYYGYDRPYYGRHHRHYRY
ncbi:hypothetical protein BH11PSE11_BH11PSE11_19240 [soil metagenome]